MNWKFLKLVLVFAIFIVLGSLGTRMYISMHEVVHARNFNSYNMTSEIELGLFSGVTKGYPASNCNANCIQNNVQIENIGYHTGIIVANIWLIAFAFLLIKIILIERKI